MNSRTSPQIWYSGEILNVGVTGVFSGVLNAQGITPFPTRGWFYSLRVIQLEGNSNFVTEASLGILTQNGQVWTKIQDIIGTPPGLLQGTPQQISLPAAGSGEYANFGFTVPLYWQVADPDELRIFIKTDDGLNNTKVQLETTGGAA